MKILLKNDNPLSECYLRYADILEKSEKYDCVILSADVTGDILEKFKNILLIERLDGAAIHCRKLLKHQHVKTLLKMYHYPDLEINNRPAVDGRIFIPFDGTEKPQLPELTQADMDKVQPGFNFLHYSRMKIVLEFAKTAKLKSIAERGMDLFFAGTALYNPESPSGAWITRHRAKCLENIANLGKQGLNVVTADHREFRPAEYYRIMADTKVILSPFGWGEFCYRDYEALLCGCIVVKPHLPIPWEFLQKEVGIAQLPNVSCVIFWDTDFPNMASPNWQEKKTFKQFTDDPTMNHLAWSKHLLGYKQNEKQIIERILE